METRLLLALLALASPALAQTLPAPNLGTGTKLNGLTITTTATKGQGTSVSDPGTGNLETLLPVQSATGASKTFTASDLYKETRRSNSGAVMSDTFPASTTTGMVNGARIFVNNVDASATVTIAAGSGTTINGTSSVVLGAGRSSYWVYDAPNTAWRPTGNSLTSVLAANNLAEIASAPTALTNLNGVSQARTISTSGSLVGGGDLSANRTLTYAGDGSGTSFTPTLSCASGSLTTGSASGRYKQVGTKIYLVSYTVTITTAGTCQYPIVTLPNGATAAADNVLVGGDTGSGTALMIRIGIAAGSTTTQGAVTSNAGNAGVSGSVLKFSGWFEAQ